MHVVVVTRNKSLSVTTLHTVMTIAMYGMHRNEHINFIFTEDGLKALPKLLKTGDRVVWFDYGTNLDHDTVAKSIFAPMDKDIKVIVYPSVSEGIDWEMFRKKTLDGSKEPASQRGLKFDTTVEKKPIGPSLYDVQRTSARVWMMDTKPIDKKVRGDPKVQRTLPTDSYENLFDALKSWNIRIAAVTSALVVRHYTHECTGNILEMPGIRRSA